MGTIDKIWKLDSPSMCRDFLKQVRFGALGSKITFLQQADGTEVSIDDASDEQVLQVANDMADAIGRRK